MVDTERHLNALESRRLKAQHRQLCREEALEALAAPLVGELCREGKEIFYCWPIGGKYFESSSHTAVVDYLVRNCWVTLH